MSAGSWEQTSEEVDGDPKVSKEGRLTPPRRSAALRAETSTQTVLRKDGQMRGYPDSDEKLLEAMRQLGAVLQLSLVAETFYQLLI